MRLFKRLDGVILFKGQSGSRLGGFTLVEIMVVVLILSTLALLTIPAILRVRVNANESVARATLKTISNALETYMGVNSVYPPDPSPLILDLPAYVNDDYFVGVHNGYTFVYSGQASNYTVTAAPATSSSGTRSYTISTGGILVTW